ncbi:glycosyltransferase [Candidatus Korobacter versatilis]|uniref:glycosyltransferase n=1 Tax=Candidatus Korobacter versatilis TaxID=658062 RepID=UPI001E4837AE|nr:glycosyltransferase [Candidatus Koribacter versatilis]
MVIPAKNESRNLPGLLTSLSRQDYPQLARTKVFVADASSTDGTPEIARSFDAYLNVEVIAGGLPSVGRNAGAKLATTRYALFIDADIELEDPTLLRRATETMRRRNLHCLTTNIWCSNGRLSDHALYIGNNLVQYFASWTKPFATGMFMLFERAKFNELGGFNEKALYAEDYLLTKQVSPRRFGIVRGSVSTTNRRFQKMGHLKIVRMFLKTALNSWNESYFLRDHQYWKEA